jgi:hypothetical protein
MYYRLVHLYYVSYLSQALSKHVTRQCTYTANRIIGGRKMRTEIRRLAHDMGSVAYQGSRILQIHLFEMCTGLPIIGHLHIINLEHHIFYNVSVLMLSFKTGEVAQNLQQCKSQRM